ncbi:MAG: hypothetical protein U9N34_02970 [Candidatus Cloacimonadota bacterium]|nr:hypothetical protein [Candidatus Cloacimonadota bacterium]
MNARELAIMLEEIVVKLKNVEEKSTIKHNTMYPIQSKSHIFATVIYNRQEDSEYVDITIIADGRINQFLSNNNMYNPSSRRTSVCLYIKEESTNEFIKTCVIQHKGTEYLEILPVSKKEIDFILNRS